MSISLILIPFALPAIPVLIGLRIGLGKKGFEKLLRSMEVRLRSRITTENQLRETLIGAGYDLVPWLGTLKTHLKMRSEFLTWELEDGKWVAVFSKSISQDVIARFISDLNAKSNSLLFSDAINSMLVPDDLGQPIPTNFVDRGLLSKTLTDCGATVVSQNDTTLLCSVGDITLRFSRQANEPYQVVVEKAGNRPEVLRHLLLMDEDYKRNVQNHVYQNLKAHIQDTDLAIESEEVLADNSIVLTLVVQESA
jgi:hypothetical protein